MRRVILPMAAWVFAMLWAGTASAQFFGLQRKDPLAEIDAARKKQQQLVQQYARQNAARNYSTPGASRDVTGRMDLSGRQLRGYPAVRGDIGGPGAGRISRGGANGPARGRGRR